VKKHKILCDNSGGGILESAELETVWTCPNCGSKMEKSKNTEYPTYVCPDCGCTIEGTEQNYNVDDVCPNCHQPLDENNECPYCGYDLGSDFD